MSEGKQWVRKCPRCGKALMRPFLDSPGNEKPDDWWCCHCNWPYEEKKVRVPHESD